MTRGRLAASTRALAASATYPRVNWILPSSRIAMAVDRGSVRPVAASATRRFSSRWSREVDRNIRVRESGLHSASLSVLPRQAMSSQTWATTGGRGSIEYSA